MNFHEYQEATAETDVSPGTKEYYVLGLIGEAGELANHLAKEQRDNTQHGEKIVGELGDILWFLTRLANYYGLNLEEIAAMNIGKLRSRKERGTISGSGDDR